MSSISFAVCLWITLAGITLAISIESAGAAESLEAVAVDWNDEKQVIDGFGASSAWYPDNIMDFPEEQRDRLVEFLFDPQNGIGCSILRIRIHPKAYPEDTRQWDWKNEHVRKQAAFVNLAREKGVQTVLASPWSPPAWMKTNGKTQKGGSLKPEHYAAYADYLEQFVSGMQAQFGVRIDVLSLQNESDETKTWECCKWTPETQTTFLVKHLAPRLKEKGAEVKLLANEGTMWNEEWKEWMRHMLSDPEAHAALDIVGGHRYRKPGATPFPEAHEYGKRLWMTEYYWEGKGNLAVQNARQMHAFLVDAEANAYLFWWLFAKKEKGGRQSLIRFSDTEHTFSITPKAYAFGQFSRFVRPGYQRIGTHPSRLQGDICVSAFKNDKTGEVTVIAVNPSEKPVSVSLNLLNATVAAWKVTRTSQTEELAELPQIAVPDRQSANITLDPESVTSFCAIVEKQTP